MSTRLATAALAVALLAAGALWATQASDAGTRTAAATGITVIVKNSQWPLAGYITLEPCKRSLCWAI